MALALAMRQLLWRDEADRLILEAEKLSERVVAQAARAIDETVIVNVGGVSGDH